MSVGLYARKDYFEIPSSIAELYETMVKEMLDRHRFKDDPGGAAVVFQLRDKYRFLREFALSAARGSRPFDEFSKAELVEFGKLLAPDLNAVSDSQAFIEEIIQRSGLLSDVGEGGQYIFAHRSIQEFLAAEELRLAGGDSFLLARVDDSEWRQVIQFYTAGQEQRKVNDFLLELSQRNPELAGYCLAGAQASDDVAAIILDALQPVDGIQLAALAAATMSPRLPVQQMAIDRLQHVLSDPRSPLSAISGEIDAMLPLLSSLAGTNAAEIAGLVPRIIKHVPDDPRLVEPLWRCLTAQGIESLPACRAIVERLLTLATTSDGFEELARQESYTRDFLTDDTRHQAYPFKNGLGPQHNMVTLLAWAEYLHVTPSEPNRYFEVKVAGHLERVEGDRRRTVVFSPFRPAKIFCGALALTAVIAAGIGMSTDPSELLHPFGWWTLALVFAAAITPMIVLLGCIFLCESRISHNSRLRTFLIMDAKDEDRAHLAWSSGSLGMQVLMFLVIPFIIPIALLPLSTDSFSVYCVVAFVSGLLYWIPVVDGFSCGRHYYLYRPSPYINVYDDPRSRHWVTKV